jgi:hypothetical protein
MVMACRIRHVAYVEKENPLERLNLSMATSRPCSPSWMRSSEERSVHVYCLVSLATIRLCEAISSARA